jgi:1,2-diacylglycerol 3-alpha-glucosyltransferase
MKIGILTNSYPPNLNGVSVSVKSLTEELQAKNHQVFIATPEIQNENYPPNILPIRSAPVPKSISPDLKLPYLYVNQASKFFAENEVEIIHTHDTVFGGLEGLVIGMRLNIPTVHTFHTMIENYDYFKFPGYQSFIKNFIQTVCSGYGHIISPSQKVYNYLLSIGVSSRISHIFNVPSLAEFNLEFDQEKFLEYQKQTKINPNQDFVFITFCRLAKEKGLYTGIKVMQPLLKKHKNIKYLILGSGPEEANLKKLAKDFGLANQIIFTGKYTRDELPYYAKLSKLFLFTSTTDNLPTNIFEAMFLNLPVASIDDSSVDYLLQNHKNGIKTSLENLSDECEKLFQNPNKLKEFSAFAKESANNLNPAKIAQEHIDLYRRNIEYFNEKQNQLDLKTNSKNKIFEIGEITNLLLQNPLKTFDKISFKPTSILRDKYQEFLKNILKSK